MNTVDSKNIPLELGNRHNRRKLAALVRKGVIDPPESYGDVSSVELNKDNVAIDATTLVDSQVPDNNPSPTATEEVKVEDLVSRIIAPHGNASREVTQEDVDDVLADGQVLVDLCYVSNGLYQTAFAMAHPQIEAHNPLRFFALANGMMVCNPKITRHTRHPVDSLEGCMSAPNRDKSLVQRYHKIEVEFQTIDNDKKLTEVVSDSLSGTQAKVWQHEISHLNGHYCFDENFTPEHALPTTN